MLCNFQKFVIIDTARENHPALKTHYALWYHKYDICILLNAKFFKKKQNNDFLEKMLQYQPILCYLYAKTIKRRGKILLHN